MDEKLEQRLLKLAKSRRKSGDLTIEDISRRLDVGINTLEKTIRKLKKDGYELKLSQGKIEYLHQAPPGKLTTHNWRLRDGGWVRFGVLGDTHLGNRCARIDVLNTAYDHFAAEGIDTVYHTGNLVDGYSVKINAFELNEEAGGSLETQTAFAHQTYPQRKGITTYFITADDHEGWWAQRIGVNVGRVMQNRFHQPLSCEDPTFDKNGEFAGRKCEKYLKSGFCEKHGRKDLIYLGHEEADIELRIPQLKKGKRGPILRIIHPGGGSAYALSYKTQKLSEHLQGGEKPKIQLVGHYHKYDANYHREVYNLQTGCLEDQTIFMRKNMLAAHVGYLILECYIGRDGIVERFRHEWKPFYDRGFYRNQRKW